MDQHSPCIQELGSKVHMFVGKATDEVIAVIVALLISDADALLLTGLFRRLCKVLGQELSLFVKLIIGPLRTTKSALLSLPSVDGPSPRRGCCDAKHTTSISALILSPFQPRNNSVASFSAHAFRASASSPKYPLNAFSPHGQRLGFAIGANALTHRYLPGCLRNSVSAPWPPMLWPARARRVVSRTANSAANTFGNSSAT